VQKARIFTNGCSIVPFLAWLRAKQDVFTVSARNARIWTVTRDFTIRRVRVASLGRQYLGAFPCRMEERINKSINQSISQSTNQSINQSINQFNDKIERRFGVVMTPFSSSK